MMNHRPHRPALAAALLLAACGSSNPSSPDAAVTDAATPDAPAACDTTWQLVPAPIAQIDLLDPAPINSARTFRVSVAVSAGGCDDRAVPVVTIDAQTRVVEVAMRAWPPVGPACGAPDRLIRRPVALLLDTPGAWTVRAAPGAHDGGAAPLAVSVGTPPARPCQPLPTGCALDCDCAGGEACLGGLGLGGPFTQCATPCEFDRDCTGDGRCITIDDGLDSHCDRSLPECDGDHPCPTGYACESGSCRAEFFLGGATRAACTCDADCARGLRCAEPEQPGGARVCEVLCPTARGAWCTGPHFCGDAADDLSGVAQTDSVCVFAGE